MKKLIFLLASCSLLFAIFGIKSSANPGLEENVSEVWWSPHFSSDVINVVKWENGSMSKHVDFSEVEWKNVREAGLLLDRNNLMSIEKKSGRLKIYPLGYDNPPVILLMRAWGKKGTKWYNAWLTTNETVKKPFYREEIVQYNNSGEILNGTEKEIGYYENITVAGFVLPSYVGIRASNFKYFEIKTNISIPLNLDNSGLEYIFVPNSNLEEVKQLKYVRVIYRNESCSDEEDSIGICTKYYAEIYDISQIVDNSGKIPDMIKHVDFLTKNNKTIAFFNFKDVYLKSEGAIWKLENVTLPSGKSTYALRLGFFFGALSAGSKIFIDPRWQTPDSVESVCGEEDAYPATNSIDDSLNTFWRHAAAEEHWVIYDLGKFYKVSDVRVYANGSQVRNPCQINEVYVCDDPNCSGELNRLDTPCVFSNILEWQVCSINNRVGRWVKIVFYTRRETGVCGVGRLGRFTEFDVRIRDNYPPVYDNDADDSGGSVSEDTIVNVSTRWWDNIALESAIFRTNISGTWQNESYIYFNGERRTWIWFNTTINTSGLEGTVCWNQWANDSYGNWNTSMPMHCFQVIPTVYIDIVPSYAIYPYGIQFGNVDPGTSDNPALNNTQYPGTAYNITVDPTTNVNVDLYHRLGGYIGDIAPGNLTHQANATSNDGANLVPTGSIALSASYTIIGGTVCQNLTPGDNCWIRYWLDVPVGNSPGVKQTTYYICGVKNGANTTNCG